MDHNLVFEHDIFVHQELINLAMLLINLAILKLFVNNRNSFTVEEKKKLGLNKNANPILNEHNAKVETDSLNMITDNTPGNFTENEQAAMSTPINTPIF